MFIDETRNLDEKDLKFEEISGGKTKVTLKNDINFYQNYRDL